MARRRWLLALAGLSLVLASGCGAGTQVADPSSAPSPSSSSQAPSRLAAVAPTAAAATGGLPAGTPVPPSGTSQLITVRVSSATSTTGMVDTWQRAPAGGWVHVLGPEPAQVGRDGVGVASERTSRTPAGTFALTEAFGRAADPGAHLPYRRVDDRDWWVSDAGSPLYNTHQRCAPGSCPFDESGSENLGRSGASYDYAVVIDYNTAPVRAGAGSAFFLHVDAGVRSEGCVSMNRPAVLDVLRWLDPARHPVITIRAG